MQWQNNGVEMNKLEVKVTMSFPLGEVPPDKDRELSLLFLQKKIEQFVLEALMKEQSYIRGLIDLNVKAVVYTGT